MSTFEKATAKKTKGSRFMEHCVVHNDNVVNSISTT